MEESLEQQLKNMAVEAILKYESLAAIKTKLEISRKLKQAGVADSIISEATGLTVAEINHYCQNN